MAYGGISFSNGLQALPPRSCLCRALLLVWCILASAPGTLAGQDPAPARPRPGDTVWATPQSRFDANAVHRFMMGDGYRDLWATPVPTPVLDLETFAGGLTPIRKGGGLQTRSLRLQGSDGQVYNFRGLDKDAARALDPALRQTVAAAVAQDFISSILPLGAMVVDPLLGAVGVLHADPQLVLMPDDPLLGEFREEYAGLLGWIEIRPDDGPDGEMGFAGADMVTGSARFLERLEEDPRNQVDARGFLRARLLDALVGDWDRHPDQWRWAGFEEGDAIRFLPIPRDRDWALARLDGVINWASRIPLPHRIGYGFEYPDPFNLSWNGRRLDRLILPSLSWSDWETEVQEIVSHLPDPVIEDAVRSLPDPYFAQIGEYLTQSLKNRRDRLREYAWRYYRLQARWVEIRATDEEELALAERLPGDSLRVSLFQARRGVSGDGPFFERVFHPDETEEVRIYLHGDDDRGRVQGIAEGSIKVILVGGGGDDTLEVSNASLGGNVEFYDGSGSNTFRPGSGTRVDETDYEDPHDPDDDPHWAGSRDWGARTLFLPEVRYKGDAGFFLGGQITRTGYGFRHYPHRTKSSVTLGLGTRTGNLHLEGETEFPLWDHDSRGRLRGVVSGAEVNRFYGFGNETEDELDTGAYEAFGWDFRLGASLIREMADELTAEFGVELSLHDPAESPGGLLSVQAPYGFDRFGSLALTSRMRWNDVDDRAFPRAGGELELEASFFPSLADVTSEFGAIQGRAVRYLTTEALPFDPTLALRLGGEKIWGPFPYQEAATLGGSSTLLGFAEDRFAGDASAFGNAEVRLALGQLPVAFPGTWGGFMLAEAGRVWYEGESSTEWHRSLGFGLWASILETFTMTVSMARSDQGTRFLYGGGGFNF